MKIIKKLLYENIMFFVFKNKKLSFVFCCQTCYFFLFLFFKLLLLLLLLLLFILENKKTILKQN